MEKNEIIVSEKTTLTKLLYEYNLKTSQIKKIFDNKDIKIDGIRCKCDQVVYPNQNIIFFTQEKVEKKKNYETVFEDENIIVVNKFAGIETTGNDGLEGQIKNAIAVHRLDRDTRGLVIFAKNKIAEGNLLDAFKNKQITKKYICEVLGETNFKGEIYEAYLLKDAKNSQVKIFNNQVNGSVQIQTKFTTIKHGNRTSVVECELLTGKTHQIRAHLAFLGHSILGDNKYGNKQENKILHEDKQKLFCYCLKFNKIDYPLNYLKDKEIKILPNWFKNITKLGEKSE